jgi:DNA integrity scanning protein DisA with diadenylate cyclase activity
MIANIESFSDDQFRSLIQFYCNQLGWKVGEINGRRAIIKFQMPSGSTQVLFIIRFENTLEFSVPSSIYYNSTDNVPGWMSTMLLIENSKHKIGFWCLEDIEGRQVISIMHNAQIAMMSIEFFQIIIKNLLLACDKFEQEITTFFNSLE